MIRPYKKEVIKLDVIEKIFLRIISKKKITWKGVKLQLVIKVVKCICKCLLDCKKFRYL